MARSFWGVAGATSKFPPEKEEHLQRESSVARTPPTNSTNVFGFKKVQIGTYVISTANGPWDCERINSPRVCQVVQDGCIKVVTHMVDGVGKASDVKDVRVHTVTELMEARSCIAAKRLLDTTPCSVERTECSSR